jgi:hypothetical protein
VISGVIDRGADTRLPDPPGHLQNRRNRYRVVLLI